LPTHPAVWFAFCIALAVTAYSVLSINLNMLGGLWTKDSHAQTRIASVREACGLIGLIVAVSLPSLLKKYYSEQQAYVYFCLILSAVMLAAWVAFYPWISRHATRSVRSDKASQSLLSGLKSTSRHTQKFLAVYGISMLASSIPAVLVIFFVRDLLNAEDMTGLFLLLYFLSGALSMPLWKRVSERIGKYRTWMFSIFLAVASFVWAFFLGSGDVWHYAAICVFSGIALGADLALPPSILADHIHDAHNEDHAATHYALLALVAKLSLAVASAIVLPLLGNAGFIPATTNSESALLALSVAYALIPCILKLVAALLLTRFFIRSHP
jgi:Na+/melibiose symporter-like transporter